MVLIIKVLLTKLLVIITREKWINQASRKVKERGMKAGLIVDNQSLDYGDYLKRTAMHSVMCKHESVSEIVQVVRNADNKLGFWQFVQEQFQRLKARNRLNRLEAFCERHFASATGGKVDVLLPSNKHEFCNGLKVLCGMNEYDWQKYVEIPKGKAGVVFTYFLNRKSDDVREFINRIATVTDDEIIEFHSSDTSQKKHFNRGLDDFVKELAGADIVITDSAAVVATAMVFNVPFVIDNRFVSECDELNTLIEDLSLNNRCYGDVTEVNQALEYDFTNVSGVISNWREMSFRTIENIVAGKETLHESTGV